MADAPALRPLSLGEVLDVSFGLYRSLFVPLVTVAVICQAIPMALGVYLGASQGLFVNIGLSLLYAVLAAILGALGVAASTFIVSDAYLGRETSATVALYRATALMGRLIAISVLTWILVGLGFVLLIVPGLILLCGLVLSTVVAVLESPPSATAAMGRSWDLTRGFRGKVFSLCSSPCACSWSPASRSAVPPRCWGIRKAPPRWQSSCWSRCCRSSSTPSCTW